MASHSIELSEQYEPADNTLLLQEGIQNVTAEMLSDNQGINQLLAYSDLLNFHSRLKDEVAGAYGIDDELTQWRNQAIWAKANYIPQDVVEPEGDGKDNGSPYDERLSRATYNALKPGATKVATPRSVTMPRNFRSRSTVINLGDDKPMIRLKGSGEDVPVLPGIEINDRENIIPEVINRQTKFNPEIQWPVLSALTGKEIEGEFIAPVQYGELYERTYGADLLTINHALRIPLELQNITEALHALSPNINNSEMDFYQSQYVEQTLFRNSYAVYAADMSELIGHLNLFNARGKMEAVDLINRLFSAIPTRNLLDQRVGVVPLSMLDCKEVIETIIDLQRMYIGDEEETPLNSDEIQEVKADLYEAGHNLARLYRENNPDIVTVGLAQEISLLASHVAMGIAYGIDMGEIVSWKDTNGGQVGDADSMRINSDPLTYYKGERRKQAMTDGVPDEQVESLLAKWINRASESVKSMTALYDIDEEMQKGYVDHFNFEITRYLRHILGNIVSEESNIQDNPGQIILRANVYNNLKKYFRGLPDLLRTEGRFSNSDENDEGIYHWIYSTLYPLRFLINEKYGDTDNLIDFPLPNRNAVLAIEDRLSASMQEGMLLATHINGSRERMEILSAKGDSDDVSRIGEYVDKLETSREVFAQAAKDRIRNQMIEMGLDNIPSIDEIKPNDIQIGSVMISPRVPFEALKVVWEYPDSFEEMEEIWDMAHGEGGDVLRNNKLALRFLSFRDELV